ncbi:MAG: restriction endonuclease subunit S [Candidatus Kapaibacterium sp.]|nr:MAG: restriction endonuclease subunit S [Candidatus Kapabacteria bacterium]
MRALQKFINHGIPEYWSPIRLKSLIDLRYGEPLPEDERKHGSHPVYGSNGIVGYHDSYIVKGPGIIIGRKGTAGSVSWSDVSFYPIDTAFYVAIKPAFVKKVDLKWLYYTLSTCGFEKFSGATGVPGLSRNDAYSLIIPLPPLPEQRAIAHLLSSVDDTIEAAHTKIAALHRTKQGLMQQLLTGKLPVSALGGSFSPPPHTEGA